MYYPRQSALHRSGQPNFLRLYLYKGARVKYASLDPTRATEPSPCTLHLGTTIMDDNCRIQEQFK